MTEKLAARLWKRSNHSAEIVGRNIRVARQASEDVIHAIDAVWSTPEPKFDAIREARRLMDELAVVFDEALRVEHTLVIGEGITSLEAQKIARAKLAADKKIAALEKEQERRARLSASEAEKHCAFDGCARPRVFFAEDGRGYCKRHADDIGIRPSGKVGA